MFVFLTALEIRGIFLFFFIRNLIKFVDYNNSIYNIILDLLVNGIIGTFVQCTIIYIILMFIVYMRYHLFNKESIADQEYPISIIFKIILRFFIAKKLNISFWEIKQIRYKLLKDQVGVKRMFITGFLINKERFYFQKKPNTFEELENELNLYLQKVNPALSILNQIKSSN